MKTPVRRYLITASLLLAGSVSAAYSQAPLPDSPAIQARVDGILAKMTLDEKLAYVGGTGFAVRALPHLNLPSLEMSDGPYGTRSNVGLPSTTYAAGISLAA